MIGALPVTEYRIYEGSTDFGSASLRGTVSGTFVTLMETTAGNYPYWVQAVNSAGGLGTPSLITVELRQPADYVLHDLQTITAWDSTVDVFQSVDNVLFGPIPVNETWQQHFENQSWTTIQDQLNAGYPYYLQPGSGVGYVQKQIDYGTVLDSYLVSVDYDFILIDGNLDAVCEIRYSEDGIAWSSWSTGKQILANTFRYIEIKITFDGDSAQSLGYVQNVRVKLDTKIERDRVYFTADETDVDGTPVAFNLAFIDVTGIYPTIESGTPVMVAYQFDDVPDPTGFTIKVWDEDGTRITRSGSALVEGIVRNG